ncbi:hypothetical protein R3P38DRAFT_3003266 [Favolaschia claudopus]|uniref:MYND-type domain-containing protein n=1 Tax=Favolaschia claudopus TaxID=2862362 RepID=A0AAW0ANE5_9AGAR
MHPALHLDNLKRLPVAIRSQANAAISADTGNRYGTVDNMRLVRDYVVTAPETERACMLPILYSILDPSQIPNLDSVTTRTGSDKSPTEAEISIPKAIFALEALYTTPLPESIGIDLWPRVWPWMRFLHLYTHGDPSHTPDTERKFFVDFILFAYGFFHHAPTMELITSTSWLWFMFGRAWLCSITIPDPAKRQQEITDSSNMDELLNGIGGTTADLARLVVAYLDALILDHNTPNSALTDHPYVSFVGSIFKFLFRVDPTLFDPKTPRKTLGRFGEELLAQPILGVLSRCLRSLVATITPGTTAVLQQFFALLRVLIVTTSGWAQLPVAAKNGLIPALLSCAGSTSAPLLRTHLRLCFTMILPLALTSYALLSALQIGWPDVESAAKQITDADFRPIWAAFSSLVNERLQVVNEFNCSHVAMRACDNFECSAIDSKNKFRRCSGCRSFYYCSSACQSTDWRNGGHRKTCGSYGTILLGERNTDNFTSRQRSFLRALVHHDYQKERHNIDAKRAAFFRDHPPGSIITLYDYTQGAVRVEVKKARNKLESLEGSEWNDLLSRAAASGGRMSIDLATIPVNGPMEPRHLAIPLHSSSGVITQELTRLATTLPPMPQSGYLPRNPYREVMAVMKAVSLIHRTAGAHVVEIH